MTENGPLKGKDALKQATPEIDEHLARRLVDEQFPQWADLQLAPMLPGGIDNRTFRLGSPLTVRLPSDERYEPQVDKEQRWLPVLAPLLPLPIPTPAVKGEATEEYPHAWSVHRWIEGMVAIEDTIDDLSRFATDLADFLVALRGIRTTGGPPPGRHNFDRGGPLKTYADETLKTIEALGDAIPRQAVERAWADAIATMWEDDPVWLHGDVAIGNMLVRDRRLSAMIDFGLCGVGDPACDLAIAWTLFSGASREAFRAAIDVDDGTWARGRGWALWKALITLAEVVTDDPHEAPGSTRTIDRIAAEYS